MVEVPPLTVTIFWPFQLTLVVRSPAVPIIAAMDPPVVFMVLV